MHTFSDALRTFTARIAVILIAIGTVLSPEQALAVSTWNPTLLVNTEAFQEIDDGDGATNIELRFGSSTQTIKFLTTLKFQFSHAISVLGTISGSSLNVDRNATVGGTFAVSGSSVIVGNETVKGTLSGARLRVSAGGADIQGPLNASGAIRTESSISGSALRIGAGGADVQGPLNASGSVRTDGDITLGADDAAVDVILTFMNSGTDETLTWLDTLDKFQFSDDISVVGTISGSILRIDGNADINGALSVTGSILTEGDITLGGDDAAVNVVMTFMNSGTDETLTWLDTLDKFQFSDDISVVGNISGTTLKLDGAATISGALVVQTAITSRGSLSGATIYGAGLGTCTAASQALQYDKATGRFTCATITSNANNGSGGILSFHPEYPNAVYIASGSNMVGQLTMSGGTSARENSYVWTSTRTSIQDYWISVRVRVPDNFSSWDLVQPIELRYKTGSGQTATVNHVTVRMRDTAGALVPLTNGDGLASATWATARIKGPEATGTFTAKSYFTVYVKLAANNASAAAWGTANAAVGFLNLNFETTTP